MGIALDGTSTASLIASALTVMLIFGVAIGVVIYKAARHSADQREATAQEQREERSLQFIESLHKELKEDDRISLARFALWIHGIYPASTIASQELYAARIPSYECCDSAAKFRELYSNIIGFAGNTIALCYRLGHGTYNRLSTLGKSDLDGVVKTLANSNEFLTFCVHHAATLHNYLDFYYDPIYGLSNDTKHSLDFQEMLTQQTVDKLVALGKANQVTYQTA